MSEEHILLEVGDIIKIKPGSGLSTLPEGVPLRVLIATHSPARQQGEYQYWLHWQEGRMQKLAVIFQYGVDKYAMKLLPLD